ncbi:HIT family hydrolase [Bacillus sp. FJAT-18017]|uniref:HIT family protein n=1 Tax=Bacillus sp. FJAT-18017 TaxID=1705566 RepID=UPI0006AE1A1F|nr:HIT family protein [Bacillus sp. FJAT-18017]ALC90720.1 HIT family hydrolase [Bacillus sp. FJAT-18017]
MKNCIFCKIIAKEEDAYIIFENDYVCCFLDKYPINRGHVLVVPKKHYSEFVEVDDESLTRIMSVSKHIAAGLQALLKTDGITIMQNNGAFKDVDHYHMHIIPRFLDDGFSWVEPEMVVSPEEFVEISSLLRETFISS